MKLAATGDVLVFLGDDGEVADVVHPDEVHRAGPVVEHHGWFRQRCSWCGALICETDLRLQLGGSDQHGFAEGGFVAMGRRGAVWTIDSLDVPSKFCAVTDSLGSLFAEPIMARDEADR